MRPSQKDEAQPEELIQSEDLPPDTDEVQITDEIQPTDEVQITDEMQPADEVQETGGRTKLENLALSETVYIPTPYVTDIGYFNVPKVLGSFAPCITANMPPRSNPEILWK